MHKMFARALLDPQVPRPAMAADPGARFNAYRNNYHASLHTALRTTFPAVERLVGGDFFAVLAGAFVQDHPPRSPILARYGDACAGFIERFAALHDYPYLADVARLEYARVRAYHAADAELFYLNGEQAVLAALEHPARLHPSVTILSSPHPAFSIWHAQVSAEAPVQPEWTAETTLVWRQDPHGSVEARPVDAQEHALLACFASGERLTTLLAHCPDEAAMSAMITSFITLAAAGSIVPAQDPIPFGDAQ